MYNVRVKMPVFANFYGTNIRKDIGTRKVLTKHDLNDVIWGRE